MANRESPRKAEEQGLRCAAKAVISTLSKTDEFRNCRIVLMGTPPPKAGTASAGAGRRRSAPREPRPHTVVKHLRIGVDSTRTPDAFKARLASAPGGLFSQRLDDLYYVGSAKARNVRVRFDNCFVRMPECAVEIGSIRLDHFPYLSGADYVALEMYSVGIRARGPRRRAEARAVWADFCSIAGREAGRRPVRLTAGQKHLIAEGYQDAMELFLED